MSDLWLVATWALCLSLFKGMVGTSILHNWEEVAFSYPHRPRITKRWIPPPSGAPKLNFDGSVLGNLGLAGIGGVIRNEEGTIILYYSGPAGVCSNYKVEILSLNIGLREASRYGNQHILIEGDSKCVILWTSQASSPPWFFANIIEEVLQNSKNLNLFSSH